MLEMAGTGAGALVVAAAGLGLYAVMSVGAPLRVAFGIVTVPEGVAFGIVTVTDGVALGAATVPEGVVLGKPVAVCLLIKPKLSATR